MQLSAPPLFEPADGSRTNKQKESTMSDPIVTITGNATSVELRFTASGKAVANFRIAHTPRRYDKATQQWTDGETLWMPCTLWGDAAENLAQTMGQAKSLRVIATGRLKQRNFETRDGEKRSVIELDVDEIGPTLRWATATVTRAERKGSGGFQAAQQPAAAGGSDPWGTAPTESAPF